MRSAWCKVIGFQQDGLYEQSRATVLVCPSTFKEMSIVMLISPGTWSSGEVDGITLKPPPAVVNVGDPIYCLDLEQ